MDFGALGFSAIYFRPIAIRFLGKSFIVGFNLTYCLWPIAYGLLVFQSLEERKEGRVSGIENCISIYKLVRVEGVTRTFRAPVVAQKPNPGPIFEFHGQFRKYHDNMMDICAHDENPECLVPCTPEETRAIREQLLMKKIVERKS